MNEINSVWFAIVERMSQVYGIPLPHELLRLGDRDRGWRVVLGCAGGLGRADNRSSWQMRSVFSNKQGEI